MKLFIEFTGLSCVPDFKVGMINNERLRRVLMNKKTVFKALGMLMTGILFFALYSAAALPSAYAANEKSRRSRAILTKTLRL